jgi:hypothetical protein
LIFVENPEEWSVDDVYYWAIGKVEVDEESASLLKSRNVDGQVLWTYTYDMLNQIIPKFSFKLASAIKVLKDETVNFNFSILLVSSSEIFVSLIRD